MLGHYGPREQDFNESLEMRPKESHPGRWVLLAILVLGGIFLVIKNGIINDVSVLLGFSDVKKVTLGGTKIQIAFPKEYVQVNEDVSHEATGVYFVILAESTECKNAFLRNEDGVADCIYVTARVMPIDLVDAEDQESSSAYIVKSDYSSSEYAMQGVTGVYETYSYTERYGITKLEKLRQYIARVMIPHQKYKGFYFFVSATSAKESNLPKEEAIVKFITDNSKM